MDNEKPIELMLEEIMAATPEVVVYDTRSPLLEIKVRLPYNNSILAILKDGRAHVESFNVQEELRQKGIGERLMRFLTAELIKRGAKNLTGSLVSEGAVKTRVRVFGEDNVNFYLDTPNATKIKLTSEQAIQSLKDGEHGVGCDVDLTKVDLSS
jgi:GNAT superfamily N-acetyltransferase